MDLKGTILLSTLLMVAVVLFSNNQNHYRVEGKRILSNEEDLELERQLKILNKTPIKTIRTKYGDIFDCIDIYKQPALDHPLLKNHEIQMEPKRIIQEETNDDVATTSSITKVSKTALQLHSDKCPVGTVPIRRTTKKDLINAKYLYKSYHTNGYPGGSMYHHDVSVQIDETSYGGRASINLQNPKVEKDQFSSAQIWIQNGAPWDMNSIEFGWAVYPTLSGDNLTRLFAHWTADGYDTGCFNTLCQGFVQVDPHIALGDVFDKTSVYRGRQYVMIAMVYRDPEKGNWWLTFGREDTKVGYWPKELFTLLANNASMIRYGGVAAAAQHRPLPPMGNGRFSKELVYSETCYMSNMEIVDANGKHQGFKTDDVRTFTDIHCYDIIFNGYVGEYLGLNMMFGGPGGICN